MSNPIFYVQPSTGLRDWYSTPITHLLERINKCEYDIERLKRMIKSDSTQPEKTVTENAQTKSPEIIGNYTFKKGCVGRENGFQWTGPAEISFNVTKADRKFFVSNVQVGNSKYSSLQRQNITKIEKALGEDRPGMPGDPYDKFTIHLPNYKIRIYYDQNEEMKLNLLMQDFNLNETRFIYGPLGGYNGVE